MRHSVAYIIRMQTKAYSFSVILETASSPEDFGLPCLTCTTSLACSLAVRAKQTVGASGSSTAASLALLGESGRSSLAA